MDAHFLPLAEADWLPFGPPGITVKPLVNSLDPSTQRGVRIQVFQVAPGSRIEPAGGDMQFWQEFLLLRGSVTVGNVRQEAPARATRVHGARLDDAYTEDGCLLVEIAHF